MDQQRVTDRGVSGEASGWCAPTLRCTAHCPLARLGSRHANKLDQEVLLGGRLGGKSSRCGGMGFRLEGR